MVHNGYHLPLSQENLSLWIKASTYYEWAVFVPFASFSHHCDIFLLRGLKYSLCHPNLNCWAYSLAGYGWPQKTVAHAVTCSVASYLHFSLCVVLFPNDLVHVIQWCLWFKTPPFYNSLHFKPAIIDTILIYSMHFSLYFKTTSKLRPKFYGWRGGLKRREHYSCLEKFPCTVQ